MKLMLSILLSLCLILACSNPASDKESVSSVYAKRYSIFGVFEDGHDKTIEFKSNGWRIKLPPECHVEGKTVQMSFRQTPDTPWRHLTLNYHFTFTLRYVNVPYNVGFDKCEYMIVIIV